MNRRIAAVSAALAVFALVGAARAELPRTLGFQGVLDRSDGTPLPAGAYHNVVFRLYATATGGTALWSETRDITVTGTHGAFAVALGSVTPFPDSLTFDVPLWVSVQVGTDAEMVPRLALSSTASANALVLPYTGYAGANPDMLYFNSDTGFLIRGSGSVALAGIGPYVGTFGATDSTDPTSVGVDGVATSKGVGVYGLSYNGTGVWGRGVSSGPGVLGSSAGDGVQGTTANAGTSGVYGKDTSFDGGFGMSAYSVHGVGLYGNSDGGDGVHGNTAHNGSSGVYASDNSAGGGNGLTAYSAHGTGVYSKSDNGSAVIGVVYANNASGVGGYDNAPAGGYAVYGSSAHGWSGYFTGKVHVGSLNPAGSDVAEEFPTNAAALPGTVMAIDPSHPGALCPAATAYDRKVAGVVSGANGVKTGVVLPDVDGAKDAQPVAMSGRVWVRCNTEDGPVAPGDLLTTSDTAGEAMRVNDYSRSPGATIGKAMTALGSGRGLVLALVNLE
jgi:hypothetical protein